MYGFTAKLSIATLNICQILMRYIDFCDDRGFKKFSRNLDGSLSNETSWAQKLETLMILVSNYDILLWVEQLWFNILFPKDQGSWSIAVTVPVFKISIPRLFTTKITKRVKLVC